MKKLLIGILIGVPYWLMAQYRTELNKGWQYARADKVKEGGAALSQPIHALAGFRPAQVPGTVLTNMLRDKEVPDPFYGMNNERIPDIYHTGPAHYTYWFVNDFKEKAVQGKDVFLHLRGVNYACDVFVNNKKLNDATHKGMYLRQTYNISSLLNANGNNRLAIIVYPPDPPGNPNGGQGGDGRIAKSVSHQYVAGWDWIQPIRDRNTGIWDKVYIERTGIVDVRNPHVITLVPGVRKPNGPQQPATLKVSAELLNNAGREVKGSLQYTIAGKKVSKPVSLSPHELKEIQLPDLKMENPKLWWPAGYGKQDLYKLDLQFIEQGKVTDKEVVNVGVREIQRVWNATTLSSEFRVNGQKIFIKGGNWIISDAMLRLSDERYDAEIRYHRDMNLNLIRIWGGALLERPEFYKACDKYGLLVFQDFWMSGDCNGRWVDPKKAEDQDTRRKYPDDHGLFLRSVVDGIKLIRNHPSLAIWCGGNEITPPDDILAAMRDSLLPQLDGTRVFFDYSNSDSMSMKILGGNGDGPYNIQPTDTFWKFRTYPFNSEVGSVGTGDYESLKRFIPAENMTPPVYTPAAGDQRAREKADSVWEYHKYIGYSKYISPYGPVRDVPDFANKAQIVNYDQYRALMEGFSAHMWSWYTGTIIWKTQNPWTALRGQMYDYYLDPNACLYGLRAGGEPVHVMYNPVEGNVMVVNNGFTDLNNATVRFEAWTMNGEKIPIGHSLAQLPATSVITSLNIKAKVDELRAQQGIFLRLQLENDAKKGLSENIYWLPDASGEYSGLQRIQPAALAVTARHIKAGKVEVMLSNKAGNPVSFFNRISLLHPATKERILPAFYTDNYITVLPGATRTIQVEYDEHAIKPILSVEGWNSPIKTVIPASPVNPK
ncbi:glycoside hydrolase family 2 TIM barrel-domain containing protein [Paraflavitalea sp. CAU 1676]|uniref:glycoside hydrolase family 2 protein n=1 Tax=Paraflavitalea sp. CAU 1676 TaxID=3032598 RepID=UPI0023DCE1DA|nr:glycoside hydrolase family 2 TIM barrel-domain containing protein [Paraflavitalea sp. CAU 1676]MDF2188111.1 glycoside hydrolase family 2 TIM barrel-domain containing protein [Paraflavitalea sp. CAU 1676]